MSEEKKLLITNVVYGQVYSAIFLNQHLKSMLDETNIPKMKDRVEYAVYTDKETLRLLEGHPNFQELKRLIKVHVYEFDWAGIENRFDKRYSVLASTFHLGLEIALERGMLMSALVADLVVAKHFLPKLFEKVDAGFDAVFTLPMRTAHEAMAHHLNANPGAMFAHDLFDLGYKNLHPLWVACHWEAAQFSKLPYSLIWNSGTGLVVHSFSITPIIFTPYEEMRETKHVIDVEIPSMCKNPFWAENWTDAAVIGVEPLFCYYPPFANKKAKVEDVAMWMARTLNPKQVPFVGQRLYFPDKETANAGQERQPLVMPETVALTLLGLYAEKVKEIPKWK